MEIFKSIVTNVLIALYQPFWFAVLLTIFILFFICMHISQSTPAKELNPLVLPGFVHLKIPCFFVNYFALYFLR